MEIWRDIKEYEKLYQVSNYGRVKSLAKILKSIRNGKETIWHIKEKIRKPNKLKNNHLSISLYKNNDVKCYYVHRLVAEAFIPNPNNYEIVHHKDHNPLNNRVENLEWMNKNEHHKLHQNDIATAVIKSKSITVYQYALNNTLIAIWASASEAAKCLGLQKSGISRACKGRFFSKTRNKWYYKNQYKGYKWSYKPL